MSLEGIILIFVTLGLLVGLTIWKIRKSIKANGDEDDEGVLIPKEINFPKWMLFKGENGK